MFISITHVYNIRLLFTVYDIIRGAGTYILK